ncbi:MAG: hypothetical protein QOJ65_2834 [Fimbriimonadaceae bacterium]|jgi:hypothetical protein|nr:hypothetical protein [Fimbriimonadaceae bacterium]
MSLYVAVLIKGPLDEVWHKTQDPEQHQRWDLRFTRIEYIPSTNPQKFLYETRLGFGIKVAGEGESIATRDDGEGGRTSSLRFWSSQRHSLIKEGSGYWKYSPAPEGTKFVTGYDYSTRFGPAGKVLDRIFRPLIAWATAWSFDSLRLWIDKGIPPEVSRQKAIVHALARVTLAFVWIWHGIVPKLIARDPQESLPLIRLGLSPSHATSVVTIAGAAEIAAGLLTLLLWRTRKLLIAEAIAFLALGMGAVITTPELAILAFSPVSLTAALVALCTAGYIASIDLPSAKHCDYHWRTKK